MSLMYGGWVPAKTGWFLGLSGPSLIGLGVSALPMLLAFSNQKYSSAAIFFLIFVLIIGLVLWKPKGRPAASWLFVWAVWKFSEYRGLNVFESAVVSGQPVSSLDEPDLPGTCAGLQIHDGPHLPAHGVLAVVEDPSVDSWSAVARMTPVGVGLATDEDLMNLMQARATFLTAMGSNGSTLRRVVEVVRTVPDDGSTAFEYQKRRWNADAPQLSQQVMAELMSTSATAGVTTEAFMVMQVDGQQTRVAAKAAGGGPQGYARVLGRTVGALGPAMLAAGFNDFKWLTRAELAEAVADGMDPLAAADRRKGNAAARAVGMEPLDIPWGLAGPTRSVNEYRSYRHAGMISVAYSVWLDPERRIPFDSLGALLVTSVPGERRALSIIHSPTSKEKADRRVASEIYKREAVESAKMKRDFRVSLKERKARARAESTEHELTSGATLETVRVMFTVSIPVGGAFEDALQSAEQTARSLGLRLVEQTGAHDAAFFATAVPLGTGVPTDRIGQ